MVAMGSSPHGEGDSSAVPLKIRAGICRKIIVAITVKKIPDGQIAKKPV
jgi:hypothetical protein